MATTVGFINDNNNQQRNSVKEEEEASAKEKGKGGKSSVSNIFLQDSVSGKMKTESAKITNQISQFVKQTS